jgi:hypothetical protein
MISKSGSAPILAIGHEYFDAESKRYRQHSAIDASSPMPTKAYSNLVLLIATRVWAAVLYLFQTTYADSSKASQH